MELGIIAVVVAFLLQTQELGGGGGESPVQVLKLKILILG